MSWLATCKSSRARSNTSPGRTCDMMNIDFDMAQLRDKELVGLAKQGDQDAFGELIQRHRRRCANLATAILRRRCRSGRRNPECVLESLQAYRPISTERAQFSTWLLRTYCRERVPDATPPAASGTIRPLGLHRSRCGATHPSSCLLPGMPIPEGKLGASSGSAPGVAN